MERESMKEELIIQSSIVLDENCKADSSSDVTAFAVISSLVAIVGSFTYGFATAYSSPAESGIMEDLGLSLAEYSFFGSIMIIGSMVGALLCGKVTDVIGRRGTMWSSEIFCILGWLAIAFGKGPWLLDIGRLSLGFGVGLHCYVAPVYIGEITPKSIRGACTVANQLVVTCGLSLMYFIGNVINWRTLALIGIIPCLIKVVGLFFIPESPRWLAKIGQEKKFEATLQHLRGKNADISGEVAEIRTYMEDLQALPKSRFLDLFEKKHARSLMIVVGLTVLVQFGGAYGIASYASSIFEAAGCPPIIGTTALAIIQIFFSSLGVILTDKCGRRPLWMISAAGTCLGNFLVGLGFLLQDLHQMKELTAVMVLCGILIFSSSFSVGMSGTQWIIMSEILPISVKGAAGSLVTFVNWSSSWIVTYSFNFAFAWNSTGTFFLFAIMCGSIVVFVAKLLPETRGRTLEEIQERI